MARQRLHTLPKQVSRPNQRLGQAASTAQTRGGSMIKLKTSDGWTRWFNDPDDAIDFLDHRAEVTQE